MATKLALITGYARDPEFVKILLLSLNGQTRKDFDCYVYATPNCLYFLDDNFLRSLSFTCHHLKLEENKGFAGNNNFAITEAFRNKDYEYVVLANDDTIPEDSWLEELLSTAETDSSIAVVAPKMVFYQKFITLQGFTDAVNLPDKRTTGIRFYQNTGFLGSFYPKRFYTEGFSKTEEDEINPFRWTGEKFVIEMPVLESNDEDYTLRLFLSKNPRIKNQFVQLLIGNETIGKFELEEKKIYYELSVSKEIIENHWHHIIQNTGSAITKDSTYEIGFGEIDNGQHEYGREVALFCGGACLIKKKVLEETGLFMEGLFSYYEDSDLSMRIRKKGYKIVYHPGAVIRHYHTGTSKEWSPMFTYYAFRNKIIFAAKTFGLSTFARAFMERLKETYVYLKLYARSRFKNHDYRYRLKLNLVILKDSLIGIVKFKPKFLTK